MAPRRRWWRVARRVAGAAIVMGLALVAATRTGRYLVRAAWEEGKILRGRRPITALVGDSTVDTATRDKLRLVLEARAFAVRAIGLEANESFTQFTQLERDTLVVLVSGARRDRLLARTWWFPVVGRVPYKGFFDVDDARAEGRRLHDRGYDVSLRPASAFSTLGWFNDPLLSTSIRADSADLVDTVIHELLHNTFYAPGHTVFNESFANFVGARGAERFYRARGDTATASRVARRWADERVLGAFWQRTYEALDSAFALHPDDDSLSRDRRLAVRDTVFAGMREALLRDVAPALRDADPSLLPRVQFNNALVMSRRIYRTDLWLFDAVLAREGGDLRRTIDRVSGIVADRGDREPYEALRDWVVGEPEY